MYAQLWTPRKSALDGLLAHEILRREGADQLRYLRSKGIRDSRIEKALDTETRHAAIVYGSSVGTAATGGPNTSKVTPSIAVPANALVVVVAKHESGAATFTITAGGGVSSWTYGANATNGASTRMGYGISSGATGTLTFTFSASVDWHECKVSYFTGIDTVTPKIGTPTSQGSGTGASAASSISAIDNGTDTSALYVLADGRYGGGTFSSSSFGGSAGTTAINANDTLGVFYYIASTGASRTGAATFNSGTDYAGVMMAFRAAGASGIDGTLGATIPAFTISMIGDVPIDAAWAATFGGAAANLVGEVPVTGVLDAMMPLPTTSLIEDTIIDGDLAGTLPGMEATIVADVPIDGTLVPTLPGMDAAFVGENPVDAILDTTIPGPITAFDEDVTNLGDLGATIPGPSTTLVAVDPIEGDLIADMPGFLVSLIGDDPILADLAAQIPALTAVLEGTVPITGTLGAAISVFITLLSDAPPGSPGASLRRRLLFLLNEEND